MKRQDEYAQLIRDAQRERRDTRRRLDGGKSWQEWLQEPVSMGLVLAMLLVAMVGLLLVIR